MVVIFRKYKHLDEEVFAIFPEQPHGPVNYCVVYAHSGQYSGGDYDALMRYSRAATPEEYAELLAELQTVGYRELTVKRRTTRDMHAERFRRLQDAK